MLEPYVHKAWCTRLLVITTTDTMTSSASGALTLDASEKHPDCSFEITRAMYN